MENIIEINGLCKNYGDIKALNNLSFNVKEGELFAFLGINGAGKSTAINIICGSLIRDSGDVIINGFDINENSENIKKELGVVFQNSVLDKPLSVYDNLESRAALYGILGDEFKTRLSELSEILDFKDLIKRQVGKLSGGQKRRIDIARALLNHPKILILDEPTTGLDPKTRRILWDAIPKIQKEEKMTVFLTTHYMEEAADADYVVIIDGGVKIAEGTPLELKNTYTGDFITVYNIDEENAEKLGFPFEKIRDAVKIKVPDTKTATDLIIKNPEIFTDYEITKGKMDDVFLAATGKKLGEGDLK